MSKYLPLRNYLRRQEEKAVNLSFSEIQKVIGAPLPASAYRYASWWANTPKYTPQSRAWMDAGYTVVSIQLGPNGFVIFRKPGTGFWEQLLFGKWY